MAEVLRPDCYVFIRGQHYRLGSGIFDGRQCSLTKVFGEHPALRNRQVPGESVLGRSEGLDRHRSQNCHNSSSANPARTSSSVLAVQGSSLGQAANWTRVPRGFFGCRKTSLQTGWRLGPRIEYP